MVSIANIKTELQSFRAAEPKKSLEDYGQAVEDRVEQLIEGIIADKGDERRADLANLEKVYLKIVTYANENKPAGVENINGENLRPFFDKVVRAKTAELVADAAE
jgi:hypothetical protein